MTLFSSLLCWQHITLDSYIPCLTDLCKALWEVMLSYHRTMQWHEEHDKQETTPTPGKRLYQCDSVTFVVFQNLFILSNTTLFLLTGENAAKRRTVPCRSNLSHVPDHTKGAQDLYTFCLAQANIWCLTFSFFILTL